jgi:hypothetical protein
VEILTGCNSRKLLFDGGENEPHSCVFDDALSLHTDDFAS